MPEGESRCQRSVERYESRAGNREILIVTMITDLQLCVPKRLCSAKFLSLTSLHTLPSRIMQTWVSMTLPRSTVSITLRKKQIIAPALVQHIRIYLKLNIGHMAADIRDLEESEVRNIRTDTQYYQGSVLSRTKESLTYQVQLSC